MHVLLPHPILTDHLQLLAASTNNQNTLFAKQKYINYFFVNPSNCLVHLQTAQIRFLPNRYSDLYCIHKHSLLLWSKVILHFGTFSPVCCPAGQLIVITCFVWWVQSQHFVDLESSADISVFIQQSLFLTTSNKTSYLSFFLHKCTFWAQFFSTLRCVNCGKISQNFPKFLKISQNFSTKQFFSPQI